jgi:hypothetical protein
MERGSDYHSRRLDEELKKEVKPLLDGSPTEPRSEEWREQEGPAEGEPTPDARIRSAAAPPPNQTLTDDDIERRAELARHLQPRVFPAERQALIRSATELSAPDEIVERLNKLPDGTFENVEAVWEALGGDVEFRS